MAFIIQNEDIETERQYQVGTLLKYTGDNSESKQEVVVMVTKDYGGRSFSGVALYDSKIGQHSDSYVKSLFKRYSGTITIKQ